VETILNEYEARVVGSLIEKQMTTPDYYPLTLNALTHACNQKNNRDPVVAYDEPTVQRALDSLREKKLAYVFTGSESRVPKYGHLFPKSYDLSPPEVAALCVLLLRGPQTVGEIRGRTGNLHQFESLAEVEVTLQGLMTREAGPLVARLPPPAGAKEPRYAHLLSGEVLLEELGPRPPRQRPPGQGPRESRNSNRNSMPSAGKSTSCAGNSANSGSSSSDPTFYFSVKYSSHSAEEMRSACGGSLGLLGLSSELSR